MAIQMLDVAIGLVLIFIVVSTVASAMSELIEAMLKKRGRLLETGIGEMFRLAGDRTKRDELLKTFYGDASIFSLFHGDYQQGQGNLPSYIGSDRFAGTLLKLADAHGDFEQICNAILKSAGVVGDSPVATARALGAVAHQALVAAPAEVQVAGKAIEDRVASYAALIDDYRRKIAAYYEENMDRVSGWYRRHVQNVLLVVGLSIAMIFNIDAINIMRTLSTTSELRNSVVAAAIKRQEAAPAPATADCDQACADARAARAEIDFARQAGLPMGWTPAQVVVPKDFDAIFTLAVGGYWIGKLFGWLVTALAACQGAPFWFDLLNKLTNLRSTLAPDPKRVDARAGAGAAASA